jgi:uncharacterized protein YqiB (DUF1249 family)
MDWSPTNKNVVPSSEIRLLKRTANSFGATGRDVRHALCSYKLPTHPMTLGEARRVVNQVLAGWLASKGY